MQRRIQKRKIICIVGPTAVGKSQIAYLLAKRIKGEIISADSMQVYKGMPILTASPVLSFLKVIPHHLLSILDLSREYNVAKFIRDAKCAIKKIQKNKKIPLIVGGSGLYIKGLLDGIFSGPGQDKGLRKKLSMQAAKFGNEYLYKRLKKLDPESASQIHPNNLRRLIRVLEVCIKTNKKMSEVKKARRGLESEYDVKVIGLNRPRPQLYRRIDNRVDAMFRKAVVKEAEKAIRQRLSKTARGIIGIKEIAGYLEEEYNKNEAKRLIKRNSRHFAKRQMTWFRCDKRIKWIEIKEEDKAKEVVQKILKIL